MTRSIKKASGEVERFNAEKFARSLRKAGASDQVINKLTAEIEQSPELQTTHAIYTYAYNYLRMINRPLASRYNLKNALYELGPSGFPFERFVAEIFKHQDYTIAVDQIKQGLCVEHEVDVVALRGDQRSMVECKFHHEQGIKVDVKIALYVKARFDDIALGYQQFPEHGYHFDQGWLVTNTKFTTPAIAYGACVGLHLLGWSYPEVDNIAHLIDKLGVQPLTCLTSLTHQQKLLLLEQNIVLCRDLEHHRDMLAHIGLTHEHVDLVLKEAEAVVKFL
jgi:hypothetical protein